FYPPTTKRSPPHKKIKKKKKKKKKKYDDTSRANYRHKKFCFLSVEKSCSPYSSKWFGSHAVSNGQGYRQLRVSVNQPSSLHGQIVRLFPPLSPVAAAMIHN